MPDADRCDLAVWDTHGELTATVRRELGGVVRRTAPRIETACGDWRGGRVVVGWPRRLTASQLPTIREVLIGLRAVHRPRRIAILGPAAAGDSGMQPGSVALLAEASGLVTRWGDEAYGVSEDLVADAVLLAAVTQAGSAAPPATRSTAARQAGRWLGRLMGGANQKPATEATAEVTAAVAAALADLLDDPDGPTGGVNGR